jgi:hypothetical protein
VGAGVVVLIHLDLVIVRDIPPEHIDKERLSQPQVLAERGTVPVLTQKIERNVVHDSLPAWE